MDSILHQLGLDATFFTQFALVAVTYFFLSQILFKPFQRLFELRHARTVEDKKTAQELRAHAEAKSKEYQQRISAEKKGIRAEFERMISEAKKEESAVLQKAREEAKAVTQSAAQALAEQKESARTEAFKEISRIGQTIVEKLLVKS